MKSGEYRARLAGELCSLALWRDALVELVATFMLVSVQCALPLTWGQTGLGTSLQTGLGVGFVVAAMAWSLGDFSGGHMNPAVSFGMAVLLKITFVRALVYIVAQCAGGIGGAAFIFAVTPDEKREALATTVPGDGVEDWQAILVEMWITCILLFTIIGSTNLKRKGNLYMPPIFIGFAIALGIMSGFGSTGGSMNPARSLGPAVVMWAWLHDDEDSPYYSTLDVDRVMGKHWIYWVGPLCGALVAAIAYSLFDFVDKKSSAAKTSAGKTNEAYLME